MTWDGNPNYRWKKVYKGQPFKVRCEELGLPKSQWTKEGSYQAANAWWLRKKAELGVERIDEDRVEAVASVDRQILWASNHDPGALTHLKQIRAEVIIADDPDTVLTDRSVIDQNRAILEQFGVIIPPDLDPSVLQQFLGERRLWQERLSKAKAVAKDKTVEVQLAAFLDASKDSGMKPQTYNELRNYLLKVQNDSECLPASMSVERITEQTVTAHYKWLAARPWKQAGKKKARGFFNRFVDWLWQQKLLIELPRNLKAKSMRFKPERKKIKTYHNDGDYSPVREELEGLPDRLRLWALLGLNAGMTNCDLGALTWEMINMTKGTLTRVRVKTQDEDDVPEVTYRLWPETMALLKNLSGKSGLVFTTTDGLPMYVTQIVGEKAKKKDLFALYWQRSEATIPLKAYRSIGSTILKSKNIYRDFVTIFLGHAPATVADCYYAGESDKPFFDALAFVHKTVFAKATIKAAKTG